MAPIQKKPAAKTDSVRIKKESNVLNCRVRRVVNSPNVAEARGGGVRWKLCLENASSFQLYADNRLPPAVQAKILYRSYLYLEQNKKRDNFNQAMVADFNKKLCEETWEEWVKLSNMASAKPSAMRKVAEAQAAFQACQAWVVKEAMQKLTWISFEAGPLPNMQDVQFVSDVNANIRLPQALRVTLNQYGVKVAALVLKVWRLLLQHPSIKEMQLRAQNRMKTFEDLYDLVIDSIIEDDVRELQDVPGIAPHEDLLRIQQVARPGTRILDTPAGASPHEVTNMRRSLQTVLLDDGRKETWPSRVIRALPSSLQRLGAQLWHSTAPKEPFQQCRHGLTEAKAATVDSVQPDPEYKCLYIRFTLESLGYWTSKVADVGGWIIKHGSMTAVDKALDSGPCANHEVLGQKDNLVEQKIANPGMRLGKNNLLKHPEQVVVTEESKQGLQAPKKQFMALSAYEKRYGAPDPANIKVMKIRGQDVRGVDVIDEADQGVWTYIDEASCAVQRQTKLSDADLVISDEQTDVIYTSAARHLGFDCTP
ncbi:unnamed protein product [Symbiodinium sp. KB8]|nr:unnamed protein product [Symbiodinium sp. KB8]